MQLIFSPNHLHTYFFLEYDVQRIIAFTTKNHQFHKQVLKELGQYVHVNLNYIDEKKKQINKKFTVQDDARYSINTLFHKCTQVYKISFTLELFFIMQN